MKRSNVLWAFILMSLLTIGISTTFSVSTATNRIGAGEIKHVIIIVEENEAYSSIVNSSEAPYENQLIRQYSLAGNDFSPESPSLPNYIDLTAGSDLGITTDCSPSSSCQVNGGMTNIGDLLHSSNLSWKEYAESMPSPCYRSNSGNYAVRHNPFVYYTDITDNGTDCNQHVVPMNITTGAGFIDDLQSGKLPNFSFITPNLCNDGHNSCSNTMTQVQQIDEWLGVVVPKIIDSPEFASTALFITYDQGSTLSYSSQVVCILVSPFANSGYVSNNYYSHFSLLATVENIFGLGSLGRNDTTAAVMTDLFATPSATQSTTSPSSSTFTQPTVTSTSQTKTIWTGESVVVAVAVSIFSMIAVLTILVKRHNAGNRSSAIGSQT